MTLKSFAFFVAVVALSISHAAAERAPPKRMPAAQLERPPLTEVLLQPRQPVIADIRDFFGER